MHISLFSCSLLRLTKLQPRWIFRCSVLMFPLFACLVFRCSPLYLVLIGFNYKEESEYQPVEPETFEYQPFWSLDSKWFGIQMVSLWMPRFQMPSVSGVNFLNFFAPYALGPNFCASKKLLKKLGVGVGRKWIELSLWLVPNSKPLWNRPLISSMIST